MSFTILTIILIVTIGISLSLMNNEEVKNKWMFIPYLCSTQKEVYRIFSHLFIHADLQHLAFNMISLYFLGEILEVELMQQFGILNGEIYFLFLYFGGGFFATLIPYVRNHANYSYRSLGASGAVSSVVFAFIIWNPFADLVVMIIPMKAWIFGILYLAFEIWNDKRGGTGVAHDAHIGGAIFGVFFILIINIEKGKELLNLVL